MPRKYDLRRKKKKKCLLYQESEETHFEYTKEKLQRENLLSVFFCVWYKQHDGYYSEVRRAIVMTKT